MTMFSRFLLLLVPALFLSLSSCKKEDDKAATPTTPVANQSATLDKSAVTPGDVVTITTSNDLDAAKTSWEIGVGGRRLQLVKTDARQAVFVVPALPAGALALDLVVLGVQTPPSLTMSSYTTISDPAPVFAAFNTQLTAAIARLSQLSQDTLSPVPAQNVTLLRNLQQTFGTLQAGLTASEKLDAAYALQKMSFNILDPSTLPQRRLTADPADAFMFIGQLFVDRMVSTVSCVGLFAFAIKVPEGTFSKLIAVAAAAAAVYQLAQAMNLIDELANRFDLVASLNLTGSGGSSAPFTLSNGTVAGASVTATARRLSSADAAASTLLRNIFSSMQRLQNLHQTFIDGFNGVRSWFGSSSAALAPYITPLKDAAGRRQKLLDATLVKIRNVSNAAINLIGTSNGNSLSLKATSSLTARTTFTFDATYENAALGVAVTKTVAAVFEPNDSTAFFQQAVLGNWVSTYYNLPSNSVQEEDRVMFQANGTGKRISILASNGVTTNCVPLWGTDPFYDITWTVYKNGNAYYLSYGDQRWTTVRQVGRITYPSLMFRNGNTSTGYAIHRKY